MLSGSRITENADVCCHNFVKFLYLFMYYMSVLVLWHSGRGGDDRRQQTGDDSAAGGDDLN
jgi:hypothetical protein